MIHLRKLPVALSKSALQSYNSPLLKSKLLGVLLKAECTSSVKVDQNSREPSTNAEDDTNKEVNLLSKISVSTKSMDIDTNMGRLRARKLYQNNSGLLDLTGEMSIEDFKEFLKRGENFQKMQVAMSVIRKLCSIFRSKMFPVSNICKYENVESLISPDELKEVFQTIEKNLAFLDEARLLKVLEACAILKISDSSLLMQKLFKLLSSNINSMSSISVIFMYCIIEMYYPKDNHQIAALRVACNEFFENCFESNIHPNTTMITMSRFVFVELLPVNVRKSLLLKILESKTDLPFWSYSYVLKGLMSPGVLEDDEFYKESVNSVLLNISRVLQSSRSPPNLFFFLKTYKTGILSRRLPYKESFLDTLALKFVQMEPPLPVTILSCQYFLQVGHFSYAFFDYLLKQVEDSLLSGELKTLKEDSFFKLIKVLSKGVKQHPKTMNSFLRERLEAVCSNYTKVLEYYKVTLPLNLAILGIYNDSILENCFTSENGGELTAEDIEMLNSANRNSLLLLHQAVATFHPSYQNRLLSDELMKKLALDNDPMHYLWQQTVEECFGGPNYVMKNCTTSLHHTLSYVVVLDKNNVPIDVASIKGTDTQVTDEPFNINNIPTSEERRVIVIQDLSNGGLALFRNISNWKGKFHLYVDVLEMYCSGVLPLFSHEHRGLENYERVPYVLEKIEKKFGVIRKPMTSETKEEASDK